MDRNLIALLIVGLISGTYWSLIYPIYQPFIISLGASMTILGLIEALAGRMGLISTLTQLLGGILADEYGRKRVLVLASLIVIIGLSLYLLSALYLKLEYLFLGSIFIAIAGMGYPARNALIADITKQEVRGLIYGLMMFSTIIPSVIFSPIGGWIAENIGIKIIFIISLFMEATCLLILTLILTEKHYSGKRSGFNLKTIFESLFPRESLMRKFYLLMTIDVFSWNLGSTLLYGYISKVYGFTETQLGLMSSAFSASWALSQIPAGKLTDKIGSKNILILSEMVGVAPLIIWLIAKDFNSYLISHIIFGLSPALWIPALNTYLAEKVSKDKLAKTMGGISAFRGIISFPAPYIGGLLFDLYGIQIPILINLIGTVIVTIGLVFLKE